jgi:hypothetical protein
VHFYRGPSEVCKEGSTFVLPREILNAYIEFEGFTMVVLYINP